MDGSGAGDAAGRSLLDAVGSLTGADVAASDDATGHAELGGDWELEWQGGAVEASLPFAAATQQAWRGLLAAPVAGDDVLAIDEALKRLEQRDPVRSSVVSLRYFGGLTIEQTAEVLGISPATVSGHWTYARAWLYREISTDGAP